MLNDVNLADLVCTRLKEEFPDSIIDASGHIGEKENKWSIYIDHTFIGIVSDRDMVVYVDNSKTPAPVVYTPIHYYAADPKFFYHVTQHAKAVVYFYRQQAEDC